MLGLHPLGHVGEPGGEQGIDRFDLLRIGDDLEGPLAGDAVPREGTGPCRAVDLEGHSRVRGGHASLSTSRRHRIERVSVPDEAHGYQVRLATRLEADPHEALDVEQCRDLGLVQLPECHGDLLGSSYCAIPFLAIGTYSRMRGVRSVVWPTNRSMIPSTVLG